jgi:3-oxoacyl-[acyl-carrier-protein] synthase-1
MAPPICEILGVGARGPLGLNALQIAMCGRAGKIEPRRTRFVDKHGNSIGAVRARYLPDDLHGYDRLVALAVPALIEAAKVLIGGSFAAPYPLFLALPEPGRPDDDPRFGPEILADLARRSGVPIDVERSLVIRSGHAGGGLALELAALRIAEGGRPQAYLVGGVDSYYQREVLAWLDEEHRLHSGTAGNGIIPSEGAAFAVLAASTGEAGARRAIAKIASAVSAREDTVGTPAPNLAAAMTRAVRDAATLAGGRPLRWVLTDVNGERHRISEFSKVEIRSKDLFQEGFRHDALAEELGDTGAASGALLLAWACAHTLAGSAPAERVLLALHAEGQERAALVIEAASREALAPPRPASAPAIPASSMRESPAKTEAPAQQAAIDRVVASITRLPPAADRGALQTALDAASAALSLWAASALHDDDHLALLDAARERVTFARARFEDAGEGPAASQAVKTLQHVERALRRGRDVTIDHLVADQDRLLRGEIPGVAPPAAPFRAGIDLPVVHASRRDPLVPLVPIAPAPSDDDAALFRAAPPRAGAPKAASPEAVALQDLARACMEDLAILGGLRRPNDDEPWSATDRFERRLLANVDALATLDAAEAGLTEGIDVPVALLAYSAESSFADGGRAFTRAFALGCFGGEDPVRAAVVGLRNSHALTRPAQLEAFCLAPSPRIVPAMEQLLWDEDPALVRLALEVLRFRRAATLATVLPILGHSDPGVIEAAARCLAVTRSRVEAVAALEGLLRDDLEARTVLVVLECLVMLGAPSGLALTARRLIDAEARPFATSSELRSGLVRLLALAGGPEHTALIFKAVIPSGSAPALLAGVTALGWFGHAAFIEPLLEQLEAANAAPRTAGSRPTELEIATARALLRITGVYLEEDANEYGIGLSVDGAAWRAHWEESPGDLDPDVRYRFGARYHPRDSLTELADDRTAAHARRNAALEIAAFTGGAFAFEPTDWVARQREHLAVVGDAIESGAAAYEPGEWLSTHLARRRLSEPVVPAAPIVGSTSG